MNTTGPAAHFGLPRQRALLAATIALLALALAGAAWIQARQYRLLDATAQYQDDYMQVSLNQLNAEFLRLRAAVRAARTEAPIAREELQLRYDIFVSRVDLLAGTRAERLIAGRKDLEDAVASTRAFVEHADRVLGPTAASPLTAETLQQIEEEMATLDRPIPRLALEAAHIISRQIALRNETLTNYNRVTIALIALLTLTTFGFALLAMGQLRRLDERRRSLEALTADLRGAQREAEAASRAKTAFLANMSHEIRTPFQGLLGMLQLLDADSLTPKQRKQLHTARESATHLLAILNDLLDMSKLEAGTLSVGSEAVDLRRLAEDVHRLMHTQAAAKGLALEAHVDAALPALAMLDGTRVRQVLYNLISNAVKFTDHGGITLELQHSGSEIVFAVIDTGIGIDAATMARLFRRFSQGDDSRSRRHGGTGLGLEISRSLARLMGGDLTVQSARGHGSRFEMRLPLQATQTVPAPQRTAAAATRSLRVLAAEDNAVNREVLAAMIEIDGHQVTFAENGTQAVSAMRSQPYDLVLMDLHMPELDGIEATRAIRALGGDAATVPIVALTADAFAETRTRCLDAGMSDFLTKPVALADLTAMLARHASAAMAGAQVERNSGR